MLCYGDGRIAGGIADLDPYPGGCRQIDGLRTGKLAAAALDVLDQEPLPPTDPLLSLPNVVLSPHNAGMTPEAIEKGNQMVVDNVIAFLQGRPINLVNN